MTRRWKVIAAACLALGLSLPWVSATERIRFKNGHSIVVLSSRVEGNFIFLTLEDGSEVGFPKSLVAVQEEGDFQRHARPANGFGGRGPSARETMAYRKTRVASRTLSQGLSGVARNARKSRQLNSVGFSYRGSGWGVDQDLASRPRPLNLLDPADRRSNGGVPGSRASGGAGSSLLAAGTRRVGGNKGPTVKQPNITPRVAPRLPRGKGRTVPNNGKF